jgi:manganese transport protein
MSQGEFAFRDLSAGPPPAARRPGAAPASLEEVHSSVPVNYGAWWRRLFAFLGPAYLVSVGYMDPGNWATDLEGGARFNYELIWVLLLSNAIAILLQTLSARLGIVSGQDLAQACRDSYPRPVGLALWVLCEIAIAATDLAEVIGTAVALNLLFGLAPLYGVLLTAADTLAFLALQRWGIRRMEAFILTLVGTIGVCVLIEIVLARPDWGQVVGGFLPPLTTSPPFVFSSPRALYVAIGILGATVMPHNLYLHSALVQTRKIERTPAGLRRACRYNWIDSVVGLNLAFLVNASILILAAATFYQHPEAWKDLEQIELTDAPRLLHGLLGTKVAPVAFAIALLASGQSSTITGTLAGQVVMEGFLHFRLQPWMRRLATRVLAITPALVVIAVVGDGGLTDLLVLSQVVLSLQLPFAVVPLLQFTGQRERMREFANARWVRVLGWSAAAIILALNVQLIALQVSGWVSAAGDQALWVYLLVLPVAVGCGLLLLWLIASPWLLAPRPLPEVTAAARATAEEVAARLTEPLYRRIGVALDNSPQDALPLRHAEALARGHGAELVLVHVVEGVGGQYHGPDAADRERRADQAYVEHLAEALRAKGLRVRGLLRFGNPAHELARTAEEEKLDLLVLGSHGHGFLGDRLFGETSGALRHAVHVPVLTVREHTP